MDAGIAAGAVADRKCSHSVSLFRQVLGLKLAVKLLSRCLKLNLPPGKTIVSVFAPGMSRPPEVNAPVAITLSLREIALVLMMRRRSVCERPELAAAAPPEPPIIVTTESAMMPTANSLRI